jgi:hypothetical protein
MERRKLIPVKYSGKHADLDTENSLWTCNRFQTEWHAAVVLNVV